MNATVATDPAAMSQHSSRPMSSRVASYPAPVNPLPKPDILKSRSTKAREPLDVEDLSRRLQITSREKRTHHGRHSSKSNTVATGTITVTSAQLAYVPRNAAKAFQCTTHIEVVSKRKSVAPQTLNRQSQMGMAVLMPDSVKQESVFPPASSLKQRWEAGDTNFQIFDPMAERQRLYNAGTIQLSEKGGDRVARPAPALDPVKRRTRTARYDRTNWAQTSECGDDMLFALLPPSRRQSPSNDKDESADEAGNANRGGPKRTSFHEQYQDPLQNGMIAGAVRLLRDQATAPVAHIGADHDAPLNYPNMIDITDLSYTAPASPAVPSFPVASSKDNMTQKTGKEREHRGLSLRRFFKPNKRKGGGKVEEKQGKPVTEKRWMSMIEEMGIKNGIMLHDDRWEAPIVRY